MRFLLVIMMLGTVVSCAGSSDGATPAAPQATAGTPAETAAAEPDAPLVESAAAVDVELGVVRAVIDGVETLGSGVVFLGGGEVHARLLIGHPNEYLQFDLIGDAENSPFAISPATTAIATVYGLDAVDSEYTIADAGAANTFSLERTGEAQVSGSFEVLLTSRDGAMTEVSGQFLLPASESTEWDCVWDGDTVTGCDFLAG